MNRFEPLSRRAVIGATAAAAVAVAVPSSAQAACGIDQSAIDTATARVEDALIALRRDLHAHPEGSGDEERTASLVAELLTDAGLRATTGVGGHGVVGVLKGRRPGRTVAYRADMDAVPAEEQGGAGPEHLCGHDLHTAIGVGVAQVLAGLRHRLSGTVVFFFQPAEESLEGAAAMIADGVLERYDPEEIHAIHCGPFPLGVLAVMPGSGLPGLDRGTVNLTGPDAPARAEALAADIAALNTVAFPETPADIDRLMADVQTPDGPLSEFVVMRAFPTESAVELSYRCWPEDRYTEVREAVAALAADHGATADFPADPFPALVCPEREARELERHLRKATGRTSTAVMHAPFPFNGEDYALFMDELPGTFSFLGVLAPGADIATAAPHFPTFDPDERAIAHGVRAMSGWLARRTAGR
ncbi:M20 metallopeptidase family protein [Glycomyces paridis]|uniref:Amidohydrolase n=1 Tax=Glycomyces paridis TaxID=2126555 RepID=A0A4S8P5K7_9ACTN|nr:M20/M25/M40 family metallo-hydrolase [Glycomyces paridis]THV24611.1 amidohydrolase [Glycomyces paridis]